MDYMSFKLPYYNSKFYFSYLDSSVNSDDFILLTTTLDSDTCVEDNNAPVTVTLTQANTYTVFTSGASFMNFLTAPNWFYSTSLSYSATDLAAAQGSGHPFCDILSADTAETD